jgi:hypothetical protein
MVIRRQGDGLQLVEVSQPCFSLNLKAPSCPFERKGRTSIKRKIFSTGPVSFSGRYGADRDLSAADLVRIGTSSDSFSNLHGLETDQTKENLN